MCGYGVLLYHICMVPNKHYPYRSTDANHLALQNRKSCQRSPPKLSKKPQALTREWSGPYDDCLDHKAYSSGDSSRLLRQATAHSPPQ
jgi:hypothetical protein